MSNYDTVEGFRFEGFRFEGFRLILLKVLTEGSDIFGSIVLYEITQP